MRRDGGGARHATRRDPLERRRVAGRAARALRRRRAGGRVAPPPRARRAGDPRGARRGGRRARRRRRGRRHRRARADRRAARRRLGGEGARLVAAAAADPGRPSARPRRVALSPAARPRAAVHLLARERRAHDAARRPGARAATACSARRSTTRRARPSTRARGCSGSAIPGGKEIDALARRGDPTAYVFPVARVPGLDFSFSGLKTALLYTVRDLAPAELEARRADLAAALPARDRARARRAAARRPAPSRIAVVGGVAANSELRAALPDAALAPLELCTDNAAMIASAARYAGPSRTPSTFRSMRGPA